MNVIIIDMDVPKENNCKFCEKDCFWQGADVDRNNHIEDCPLKSVEGLIERIEKTERYGTSNGRDTWLRTPEDMKGDIVKIIQEYCEVKR